MQSQMFSYAIRMSIEKQNAITYSAEVPVIVKTSDKFHPEIKTPELSKRL